MDEMNIGELLIEEAKENRTREILEIMSESEDLKDAAEKVKALLK